MNSVELRAVAEFFAICLITGRGWHTIAGALVHVALLLVMRC